MFASFVHRAALLWLLCGCRRHEEYENSLNDINLRIQIRKCELKPFRVIQIYWKNMVKKLEFLHVTNDCIRSLFVESIRPFLLVQQNCQSHSGEHLHLIKLSKSKTVSRRRSLRLQVMFVFAGHAFVCRPNRMFWMRDNSLLIHLLWHCWTTDCF